VVLLRYEVPRPAAETLARPGWLRAAAVLQVHSARAPHYLFADVARQRGIDTSRLHDNWTADVLHTVTGGVYVCDFDRDGILDVLVTDVNGSALYRGRPDGTFEDVTARVGLPQEPLASTVAAWIDLDGDGYPDLILADRVYRNELGQHFADYTSRCNLRLPRDATGIVVADYDRDGRLDLYVTRNCRPGRKSWLEGKSDDSTGNFLFRNKGGWQFEDVTRASGTLGGHRSSFTAAWLDANNDGWPDLHVANEFGDGVLLINNGNGAFTEHALSDRPADYGTMGLAVGDINNDGNIDIYCANMYSKAGTRVIGNLAPDAYPPPVLEKMRRFVAGSQMHLNRGDLKFEQAGKQMQVASVGWAYGACLADLDNDGWLDLYATAGFVSRNRDEPDG
jgi:VCBS repeat protein